MTKIYYACRDNFNAGDYIGPFLVYTITHNKAIWSDNFSEPHFMISGSILQQATNQTTIIGAGFGAETQHTAATQSNLLVVRGKLTEQILLNAGYKKTWLLGDPGLWLPYIYQPQNKQKKYRIGIIPHYIDSGLVNPGRLKDYIIIDICQPVPKVIDQIVKCDMILSSSLHGIIIANAYRIPALWVEFSDGVVGGGFKFRDYFTTVNQEPYLPLDCRQEIPSDFQVPLVKFNRDIFRGGFNRLKEAVKR